MKRPGETKPTTQLSTHVSNQLHATAASSPGKDPPLPGLTGHKAGLAAVQKIKTFCRCQGSKPSFRCPTRAIPYLPQFTLNQIIPWLQPVHFMHSEHNLGMIRLIFTTLMTFTANYSSYARVDRRRWLRGLRNALFWTHRNNSLAGSNSSSEYRHLWALIYTSVSRNLFCSRPSMFCDVPPTPGH